MKRSYSRVAAVQLTLEQVSSLEVSSWSDSFRRLGQGAYTHDLRKMYCVCRVLGLENY